MTQHTLTQVAALDIESQVWMLTLRMTWEKVRMQLVEEGIINLDSEGQTALSEAMILGCAEYVRQNTSFQQNEVEPHAVLALVENCFAAMLLPIFRR